MPDAVETQHPIAAEGLDPTQFSLHRSRTLRKHGRHLRGLRGTDHHSPLLDRRSLLASHRRQSAAQVFTVVQANGGHRQQGPAGVSGGGIETPAEAGLQHQPLHLFCGTVHQRCGDQQFKRGESLAQRQRLKRLQPLPQRSRRNRGLIDPNAFGPVHQVGRGGQSDADA